MISIRDLQFAYSDGPFELRIPKLDLEARRSVVIAGPSGCGKTTLLHLLAGIFPIGHGSISVSGTSLAGLSDAGRRLFRLRTIGQVFQDFQLLDYLNVLENVLLPCRIHPSVRPTPGLRDRASELLDSVGLRSLAGRPVTRLSQGERQRVAICRALLLSPRVVLADEPTGNLDPANADRITRLLLTEAARHDALLVMVTHDQSLLPHFDRIIPFTEFLHPSAGPEAGPGGRQ